MHFLYDKYATGYVRKKNMSCGIFIDDALIGLEVELEDCKLKNGLSKSWHVGHDDSLRNEGMELRLFEPLYGVDLLLALQNLLENVLHAEINERTSLHIHADCRNLSATQLLSLMLLYIRTESVMFSILKQLDEVGYRYRVGSNFCVPLSSQHSIVTRLHNISNLTDSDKIFGEMLELVSACSKYDAVNITAFMKFGSVEWRHFQASTDPIKIIKYINMVYTYLKLCRVLDYRYVAKAKLSALFMHIRSTSSLDYLTLNKAFKDVKPGLFDTLSLAQCFDIKKLPGYFGRLNNRKTEKMAGETVTSAPLNLVGELIAQNGVLIGGDV